MFIDVIDPGRNVAQAAEVLDQLKTPAYARRSVLAPLGERRAPPERPAP